MSRHTLLYAHATTVLYRYPASLTPFIPSDIYFRALYLQSSQHPLFASDTLTSLSFPLRSNTMASGRTATTVSHDSSWVSSRALGAVAAAAAVPEAEREAWEKIDELELRGEFLLHQVGHFRAVIEKFKVGSERLTSVRELDEIVRSWQGDAGTIYQRSSEPPHLLRTSRQDLRNRKDLISAYGKAFAPLTAAEKESFESSADQERLEIFLKGGDLATK